MKRALPAFALTAVFAALAVTTPAQAGPALESSRLNWELSDTDVDNQFRGLAAVDEETAWVAGTEGTVLRTTNGGTDWRDVSPPAASGLEFRDIEAFDAEHAVALSIGEGEASQVFVTDDGGASWHNSFTNAEADAFYNCVAFFDDDNGIAMSDPVDGRVRFITTDDGGHSWNIMPAEQSPKALDGEVAFSGSGQCLVTADEDNAYLVTGGTDTARVIHTPDRGRTWQAHDTEVAGGETAGIYAATFQGPERAIVVGGDFNTPDTGSDAAAYTRDGIAKLRVAPGEPGAYRSSVDYLGGPIAVTVGPSGSDLTLNGGRDWHRFDDGAFDSVECAEQACWASGPHGRIATLSLG